MEYMESQRPKRLSRVCQGEVPMQRSLIILNRHFQVDRVGPASVGCGA